MRSVRNSLLVAVVFLTASCKLQPDADDLLNDMVVITNYDTTVDFKGFPTYSMPLDSIGLVENASQLEWITDDYAKKVTSTVLRNMSSTGRTRVGKNQSPSLAVNIYAVKDVQVFQNVVYPNYYGYPGYGYGSYYGYGGYYNYPQIYNYQSQSAVMVIELVDMINVDPDTNETRVVWVANIGDLINSPDPERKIVEAIDQAFTQSQYLKR